MDDRFLHEGERLLASRRSSGAVLTMSILRGLIEALVVGAILCIIVALVAGFALGQSLSAWIYVAIAVLALAAILFQHVHIWREATLRITTERILTADPRAFFHAPLTTIKWSQFQECEVDHREFLDIFFLARPLKFRYGTADARHEAHFPSLRYAEDLKHYFDKIDAAVRKHDLSGVGQFVAKPRGKRDQE